MFVSARISALQRNIILIVEGWSVIFMDRRRCCGAQVHCCRRKSNRTTGRANDFFNEDSYQFPALVDMKLESDTVLYCNLKSIRTSAGSAKKIVLCRKYSKFYE